MAIAERFAPGHMMEGDKSRIEEYRNRAEELRMLAETMHDKEAHATMLRIAADYEKMADNLKRIERP